MDNLLNIQLKEFLHFFIVGIEISFIFDVFRAKRKAIKTSDVVTYVEDVVYWIIVGYIFLYTISKYTNGEIRSYMFLGTIMRSMYLLLFCEQIFIKSTCKNT